eukprot:CAMPEP_0179024522 /NCGR_PEP_ID=MMETSP0796-20121207/7496_1 /TAXON_ID=73915 /ORGANISM="Pyrodinium bahamense, Strain pbaha01" /LENGTH=241 /DNA_ID=CAMNT_0020720481 /DNA_START=121 /DNA_END=847 /DNA_ORIENTATION=+
MSLEERPDHKGGPCYNQFDRVRVETTWRDRLRKETDCRRAISPPGFQLNLANTNANGGFLRLKHSHNRMEIVTEKEIKQSPKARMSLKGMAPDSLPVMAIKHMGRGPTEKWDLPATTAQESGWLLANPARSDALVSTEFLSQQQENCATFAGTMAVIDGFGSRGSTGALSRPLSLTTPANDRVLERIKSAPSLSQGPPQGELRLINNRRWNRPKNSCDVSQYAEAYQVLMHHSPFNQAATR